MITFLIFYLMIIGNVTIILILDILCFRSIALCKTILKTLWLSKTKCGPVLFLFRVKMLLLMRLRYHKFLRFPFINCIFIQYLLTRSSVNSCLFSWFGLWSAKDLIFINLLIQKINIALFMLLRLIKNTILLFTFIDLFYHKVFINIEFLSKVIISTFCRFLCMLRFIIFFFYFQLMRAAPYFFLTISI